MTSYQYWQLPEINARNGVGALSLQTASSIPSPGKGEVLVKVRAVSLNFRDLIIAQNKYPLDVEHKPVVPVSDGAGDIVGVGEGVSKFKKADRVAANFTTTHLQGSTPSKEESLSALGGPIDGMLTQYVVLPESALVHLPAHLSYEEAATLPCAALTAWNGLFGLSSNPVLPGSTVVALGTGGVSVFTAQFGIAAGAKVVITSSSDDKLAKVRSLFSKEQQERLFTVNYAKTPDWDKEVLKVSGPDGASHVLEVGGPGTIEKSHASIKRGGVIANIGFVAQGELPNVPVLALMAASVFRGILIGSVEQFRDMNTCIDAFKLKPLVDQVFDFKDAPAAYAHLASQKHVGKVVIKVQ